MSLEKKIANAVLKERRRCAWVLDDIQQKLEADFQKKLLVESDRHVAEVKMNIARGLFGRARTLILTGVEPTEESGD